METGNQGDGFEITAPQPLKGEFLLAPPSGAGGGLFAIIVAGGSGTRMQNPVPKQFIAIGGKPVLMHTLQRFRDFSPDIQIILVLPESETAAWETLCREHNFQVQHRTVAGGVTRFVSVRNGLAQIPDNHGLVAIHDGVRPFVPVAVIAASFAAATTHGTGIATVACKDSVRQITDTQSVALDRSRMRLVQTPQTFRVELLRQAFENAPHTDFADDASVAESAGYKIHLVEGSYQNIKITTPEDLLVAQVFVRAGM